jgi:hypothetical protein
MTFGSSTGPTAEPRLGRQRASIARAASLVAAVALLLTTATSAGAVRAHSGTIQIIKGAKYQLANPIQLFGVAGRVWVINSGSGLTVVNASNGSLVKLFEGSPDDLGLYPVMAIGGSNVWAIGGKPGPKVDLVELSGSTGKILKTLRVSNTSGFAAAGSMQVVGNNLWFASANPQALGEVSLSTGVITRSLTTDVSSPLCLQVTTEYNAATGALMSSKPLPVKSGGDAPFNMALVGANLWIPMGSQVIVWSTSTDKMVARFTAPAYGFRNSVAIAGDASHVWATNENGNSVTEISPISLHLQAVLKAKAYGYHSPYGDLVYDGKVWVANSRANSITTFPAT